MRQELQKYLNKLENKIQPLDELDVGRKIQQILDAKDEELTDEELAEYIAFNFAEKHYEDGAKWGTYYGPRYELSGQDGQRREFPSIQQINQEIIEYWRKRVNNTQHPVLSRRYADLVVDFGLEINDNFNHKMVQKVIDSTVEICSKELEDGTDCRAKLKRALSLALQINDEKRLEALKEKIIETEKKFAEDDKPGCWGYALQWLVIDNPDKVNLTKEEKEGLIEDMQERLKRICEISDPNPWHVEAAVKPLATYYADSGDSAELKSVLGKLEKAFHDNQHANSDGLLIVNYLEKLSGVYSQYASQFEFARKAKERINSELSNIKKHAEFKGHEVSKEIKFEDEEIENFLDSIFGEKRDEDLREVIFKIVVTFIPKKDKVEQELKDGADKRVFRHLVNTSIISEDGFPVVEFGPIDENYEQHLLVFFSRNLHHQTPSLSWAFNELRDNYSSDELYEFMKDSLVFQESDREYLKKILRLFWEEDFLPCNSLTVPLIEDGVRNIYRVLDQSFIRQADHRTGYEVKSLNALLSQGVIESIFEVIGEDIEYYLKILLTEQFGWNLRNNLAHGINKQIFSKEFVANRLMHVLLILSVIRQDDSNNHQENVDDDLD